MSSRPSSSPEPDPIDQVAGQWIGRRDRGLTPVEQDEYLHWLRQDPRHRAAMARLSATWQRLDVLADWRPEHSLEPNPRLLSAPPPRRRTRRRAWAVVTAVAAAAVLTGVVLLRHSAPVAAPAGPPGVDGIVRHEPRRMSLPDGSVVELDVEARVEVAFVSAERRVRLVRGEALFEVASDTARPFVVDAGGVTVRAVGTAFAVERRADRVTVLVTDGVVRIDRETRAGGAVAWEGATLTVGQRAVVSTREDAGPPDISVPTPAEVERGLAWQGLRLEFAELPLATVVVEFNRHNERKLVIGDAATGELRVGGNFRADNVDAFVRLLEGGFGVTATLRDDGATVLTRGR